jgi:hypothetical protein
MKRRATLMEAETRVERERESDFGGFASVLNHVFPA